MQQSKGNKTISEISKYTHSNILNSFFYLLKQTDLRYINTQLSTCKIKGIRGSRIFQTLFMLRFLDFGNVHQLMQNGLSKELGFEKDVLYSFLKNPQIDWRRILLLFHKQIARLISKKKTDRDCSSPHYLIVDDTILPKTGKTIEHIGKVFDHCTRKYVLGIKMLTLGLWDGKIFMPIDFSMHNEPGKNQKRGMKAKELESQFTKEREPDAASLKRILEVNIDKIENSINLIQRAVKKGIKAQYVLADTWFICEKFIKGILSIKEAKMDVIGLMKTNRKIILNEKTYMASSIPGIKRKEIKYSKKMKCDYISQIIEYKGIAIKAYWIKMKGQQTWKMLVSTDIKLTFTKAMEHYQVRWSIEVFFKDCKQTLKLNACQSTDLDAQIASVSIVFMNYMVLAMKKRFEDYESLGGIFRGTKDDIMEKTIVEKIWIIFIESFLVIFAPTAADWEIFMQEIIQNKGTFHDIVLRNIQCLFNLKKSAA